MTTHAPRADELDRLFLAFANACADQDAAAWQALIHPRAIEALSGPKAIVLEYHRMQAFRRPYTAIGWRLEPVWEATETEDMHRYVPLPTWIARRVKAMPFGLDDAVMERMLAEHEGQLRFVLRDHEGSTLDFMRDEIARQEERWRWAREYAAGLPVELLDEVNRHRPGADFGSARRAVAAHEDLGLRRTLEVVHVVWAEAARRL